MEKSIHYDFIEIGTADFWTLIEESDDDTVGISIEPVKYYIDKLPVKKNVIKVQAALSDKDGFVDVYYIEEHQIRDNHLKYWVKGCNSINNRHPFVVKEIGQTLYDQIVTIDKVPSITWKTLIENYNIGSIGQLKIDTEGHDHIILNEYLDECDKNPNLLANVIRFEYFIEVSNMAEMDKVVERFQRFERFNVELTETDIVLTRIHKMGRRGRKMPTHHTTGGSTFNINNNLLWLYTKLQTR